MASHSAIVQSSYSSILCCARWVLAPGGQSFPKNSSDAGGSVRCSQFGKQEQAEPSPAVGNRQYPPPVLVAAPSSVLSGGHSTLQPHDPCLALSFSGSLFFPHTHTQGEELRSLPSSNPQPTSPLLSRQRLFSFFSSLLTPPNKCVNSACVCFVVLYSLFTLCRRLVNKGTVLRKASEELKLD